MLASDVSFEESHVLLQVLADESRMLAEFTPDEIEQLARGMAILRVHMDETIMAAGEESSFVGILLHGKINVTLPSGATLVISSPCLLGELSFFEGGRRTATVTCHTRDALVAMVTFGELNKLRVLAPLLRLKLVALFATEGLRKSRELELASKKTSLFRRCQTNRVSSSDQSFLPETIFKMHNQQQQEVCERTDQREWGLVVATAEDEDVDVDVPTKQLRVPKAPNTRLRREIENAEQRFRELEQTHQRTLTLLDLVQHKVRALQQANIFWQASLRTAVLRCGVMVRMHYLVQRLLARLLIKSFRKRREATTKVDHRNKETNQESRTNVITINTKRRTSTTTTTTWIIPTRQQKLA